MEDSQSVKNFDYERYTDKFTIRHIIKLGEKEYNDFLAVALNDQLKISSEHKSDEGEIGIFRICVIKKGKEEVLYLSNCKSASSYFNDLALLLKSNRFNSDLSETFKYMHELVKQYIPK